MSAEDEHMARFLKRFGEHGFHSLLRLHQHGSNRLACDPNLLQPGVGESLLVAEPRCALQRACLQQACLAGSVRARQNPLSKIRNGSQWVIVAVAQTQLSKPVHAVTTCLA